MDCSPPGSSIQGILHARILVGCHALLRNLSNRRIEILSLLSSALAWGFFTTSTTWEAPDPITLWQIYGEEVETVTDFIFLSSKITADGECSQEIKRCLLLGRKAMTKLDSELKTWDIPLLTKVRIDSQSYGFSSSHVWMWELDHKESWKLNNWCLRTMVLEKTLESPLDSREIKPASLNGNQPWIFIGRTEAEAEASILWLPDAKNRLIGKHPETGKDWGQEKGMTDDEMVGWHH